MKKKVLIISAVILLILVILVVVAGPVLNALGVEVFCLATENGRTRLVRCGGEKELTSDTAPPRILAGARPVLIDTDMAVDDWLAILYLLQLPDIDVQAITVTGAGEAHCRPGVRNGLDLVALAGRPEIPVTCGRETPLQGNRVFPKSLRDNVDALAGLSIPTNPKAPVLQDAAGLISERIKDNSGELEIIALGPVTNLAEAFLAEPALVEKVKQVTIMGGAFYVPGNVSALEEANIDNDAAEWNTFVDPYAANVVINSGAPVTFIPLDASNHVLLDEAFYDRLEQDRSTPEAEFVYQALGKNLGFVRSGNYYFWDPLTAAVAVDESLAAFETRPVSVLEGEGPESGATRVDESGTPVRIATAAAGERFIKHFLDVLNGRGFG